MNKKSSNYTLILPFLIQLGDKLNNVGREGKLLTLPNGKVLKLTNYTNYCDLSLSGFTSVEAAKEHLNEVLFYLYWISLNTNFKVDVARSFQEPFFPEDPVKAYENNFRRTGGRIDAAVCGLEPYVVKSGSCVSMMYGQSGNLTVGHSIEKMEGALDELNLNGQERAICLDEKLMLALELYNNLTSEKTLKSKFIQMNSIVEILIEPKSKPILEQKLIQQFEELANKYFCEHKHEYERSKNLKAALKFMKVDSIRFSVAALTERAFKVMGRTDWESFSRKSKKAYDVRSELVHNGHVRSDKLKCSYKDLKEIVEVILRAKVLHYKDF